MFREIESLMTQLKTLTQEERDQYVIEVTRWLLYRDYNPDTWYAKAQKAMLQEIYILRNQIKEMNKK